MTLNDKFRLYFASDRTDDEIEALIIKIVMIQSNGSPIKRAIESSLDSVHMAMPNETIPVLPSIQRESPVRYLLGRHKAILIELRSQGYGYGKIASILGRRKIYNKATNKAYSRQTIKNVIAEIEKEKNGNA